MTIPMTVAGNSRHHHPAVRANDEGSTPPVSEQVHRALRCRHDRGLVELLAAAAITNAQRQTPVRAKRSAL